LNATPTRSNASTQIVTGQLGHNERGREPAPPDPSGVTSWLDPTRRAGSSFFVSLPSCSSQNGAWAQGEPLGPEFRVNTYTTREQEKPSIAADAVGNFVVVWVSSGQDRDDWGVFGQRYSQIVPC
jgi:hypothetical protein